MGLAGPSAGAQGMPVSRSSSMDVNALATALRQLEFEPPADDDRFVWEDTDVSATFHGFRLMVKAKLERKETLTYEGDVQLTLALSSILLLKPNRTHPDLYRFLVRDICERLRTFMVVQAAQAINMDEHFSFQMKNKVEAILCKLKGRTRTMESEDRPYSRLVALREITALMEGTEMTLINKILKSIQNMVQMLPRCIDQKGPLETEYITRHLHAILSPLFEDIDNDILFRWTSVGDKEKEGTMWPDASINVMQSSALGPRLGCDEVKSQYQAQSSRLIGIDLVRLGYLAKDASDKNKAVARFAFFVVGDHVTFYILQRVQGQMYIMSEIEHITLPQDKITRVISAFKYVTNCGNHTYPHDPRTVTDQVLKELTEKTSSRKRKAYASHGKN
ncbi:hypothetical protein BCR43DRAFT_488965 [Syncephalastrum racemosum]|uniref:Uncharacterized protein n=1 Tax=Syncephalastrum racemosum TaxID=13706 RepID=A0A1X2HJH3_SYNRA|nr:hypothetical protein BCR43DRAFT_488965 [Syncephalastrum racemosum]